MNEYNFKDRTAVITGGAQGFGFAISKRIINSGGKVIIWDVDKKAVEIAQKEINSKNFSFQIVDITDFSNVEKSVGDLEEQFGKIDIFVNNAGMTGMNAKVWDYPLNEWKKVIDLNLTSTFLLSKHAIKKMLKNKFGKIVNITSVVGHTGNLGQANYTASKAGIVAMSKSLAIEYAKKNINVNCISPGFIKTAMTDKIDDKFKEVIMSKIPSARLGEPDDIANAVLFLSSDQSNYINGETLHVNGGMYMA